MISKGSKRNRPCAESLLLTPPARDQLQSGRHHLQLANGANDVLLFKASCIVVYRLPEGEGGGGIPLQWVSPCSSTTALVKELLYLFGSIFNERHLSADRLLFSPNPVSDRQSDVL